MTEARAAKEPSASRVFRLFPTCKPVRGGAFSAIYDLDRRRVLRFDSAYFALFEAAARQEGLAMQDVDRLDAVPRERALAAMDIMLGHEVGLFIDDVAARCLIPLPGGWDAPREILNSIVDVDAVEPEWEAIFSELIALRCRGLQVRCFSSLITPRSASTLLERLRGSCIAHVEFVVKWSPEWDTVEWPELLDRHRNLLAVRIHSAPADLEIREETLPAFMGKLVVFQTAPITGAACCGTISEGSLSTPSVALFSELKEFNGCLNRKVSFRADGEICNCPSMRASFGKDPTRIRDVVASPEFQRVWQIRKDDISVCSGCEFRYVCTDCRAYLESDVSTAKPSKCRYDPATGVWDANVGAAGCDGE